MRRGLSFLSSALLLRRLAARSAAISSLLGFHRRIACDLEGESLTVLFLRSPSTSNDLDCCFLPFKQFAFKKTYCYLWRPVGRKGA